MAGSRTPGTLDTPTGTVNVSARTSGPLGTNDQGDPNVTTRLGDTPGPLGHADHGDPNLPPAANGSAAGKLPDGTAVAPGSDGKAAALAAAATLAPRSDSGKVDIDWSFISAREGGQRLDGYVPAADQSSSGVTVGTGIDLGARSATDIDKLDVPADLKKTLKPYCGKKAQDAKDYLKDHPLQISDSDAASLDKAVKQPLVDALVAAYNAAVDSANSADSGKRLHFEQLPQSVQTAVASASFQYGSLAKATPNYWKQVTEQRWKDAMDNLKSFGDAYPTRRKLEAGLLESALNAAKAQAPAAK